MALDRLITLMIVNNEFLQNISPLLNDLSILPSSGYARIAIGWVLSYGAKHNRAPRANLRVLFEDYKRDMGGDDANVDLIDKLLTRLDGQYKRGEFADVDVNFELERAEAFLQQAAILKKGDDVRAQVKAGNLKEAMRIEREFVLPSLVAPESTPDQMFDCIVISGSEFCKADIPAPQYVIAPWLTDGSLTMVYAPRGVGKTWLCGIIAGGVTRTDYRDVEIGPWRINNSAGTLWVDGEMQEFYLQQRIKKITSNIGSENVDAPLTVFSATKLGYEFRQRVNIANPQWQDTIYEFLRAREQYQLLILDNIAALGPNIDENSKQDWDPINQWLLSFRELGVSVIFVHHAGKTGKQRGTSGREDALDNIIRLWWVARDRIPESEYCESNTYMNVFFEKARNADPEEIKDFILEVRQNSRRHFSWGAVEPVPREND